MDRELIEKIFHRTHEQTIESLREFASSPKAYEAIAHKEKIFYVFFFTENGQIGLEPFIKNEKNKCFTPIHEDFLMSGERFGYTIISHDFVEDALTQELINDDEILPDEIVQILIHLRDKKDAEFIEALAKTWSNEEEKYVKNDIFECL